MSGGNDIKYLLGDPRAAIRRMFLPFFIAFAVVEINNFVDTYWVAGLGSQSAQSVATIIPIYDLLVCVGIGIGIGSTTTIAYRIGHGDNADACRLAGNSVSVGIISSVLFSIIIAIAINPAIDMLGAGNVRDEALQYMIPLIVLSPLLFLNSILGGTLRGEGAAKKSTAIQMSTAILNIVFDPILIYSCGMGVMGAGLATALASGVSVSIGLYWYYTGRTQVRIGRPDLRPDKQTIRELLDVGGPAALRQGISDMTNLLQRVFIVMAGGTTAVMLYNYPWKYINIVALPTKSLDAAMIPVCSAAFGQSDIEKMRAGYRYTLKYAVSLSLIFAVVMIVFATPLMSILTYEESMQELLPQLAWTLSVSAILVPFNAMMGVSSSLLQSMKKARIPMYFYLSWGFVKLILFAIAAMGWMGIDPFQGIIYSMVGLYIVGGFFMLFVARREFAKIERDLAGESASDRLSVP